MESPMADHREYLPPTHCHSQDAARGEVYRANKLMKEMSLIIKVLTSQKANMLSLSIPNLVTSTCKKKKK